MGHAQKQRWFASSVWLNYAPNQWCSKLVASPIKYRSNNETDFTQLEICKLKLRGCFSKEDYFKNFVS